MGVAPISREMGCVLRSMKPWGAIAAVSLRPKRSSARGDGGSNQARGQRGARNLEEDQARRGIDTPGR
jgi:hypothetical protein